MRRKSFIPSRLNYISQWLDQDKSNKYKKIGISQIKNKTNKPTYTKGKEKQKRITTYKYDKAGNLTEETDEEGTIKNTYNLQNQLIKQQREKPLYIPQGLKLRKEIFNGFAKEEMIKTILITLIAGVVDTLLYFIAKI